jgi:hypothetical protein
VVSLKGLPFALNRWYFIFNLKGTYSLNSKKLVSAEVKSKSADYSFQWGAPRNDSIKPIS